jgi:hypothetical protein
MDRHAPSPNFPGSVILGFGHTRLRYYPASVIPGFGTTRIQYYPVLGILVKNLLLRFSHTYEHMNPGRSNPGGPNPGGSNPGRIELGWY